MPLLNFKKARDAHAALGAGPNDVAYYSTIQDWRFQVATPAAYDGSFELNDIELVY